MRDTYEAGRAWLLSSAEGEHVDAAIDVFVKHAGLDPGQVVKKLYENVYPENLDECSSLVKSRIERYGLTKTIKDRLSYNDYDGSGHKWSERFIMVGVIAILLFCMASCSVGAAKIVTWMFGVE